MATVMSLPNDDFLSDRYMEAFYKAHVASRTRGNIDEDIAAIEAEIKKVKKVRSTFRRCRYEHPLNSCGSSECSDEDDLDTTSESSSAVASSVFKVCNSTSDNHHSSLNFPSATSTYRSKENAFMFPRGMDIFTWAVTQQMSHDHSYSKSESFEGHTFIERGTINIVNIQWHLLSASQRAQAVHKLSSILQHRPSGRQSPTFSSFDLLPTSLANIIKKTGSLGLTLPTKTDGGGASFVKSAKSPSVDLLSVLQETSAHKNIGIKEVKGRERMETQKTPVTSTHSTNAKEVVGPVRSSSRKRIRQSPYTLVDSKIEVTGIRNDNSCSKVGEDPLIHY